MSPTRSRAAHYPHLESDRVHRGTGTFQLGKRRGPDKPFFWPCGPRATSGARTCSGEALWSLRGRARTESSSKPRGQLLSEGMGAATLVCDRVPVPDVKWEICQRCGADVDRRDVERLRGIQVHRAHLGLRRTGPRSAHRHLGSRRSSAGQFARRTLGGQDAHRPRRPLSLIRSSRRNTRPRTLARMAWRQTLTWRLRLPVLG